MNPLKCRNWSGRHLSLTPPASLTIVSRTIITWLVMGLVGAAQSATNTVASLADNGTGSLRQVIQNSASGDCVIFTVTGTIVLTNGELAVAKNLTIRGPGASALAISGNRLSRVLNVSQSVNVFLSDLTICNGQTADGTTSNPPAPGGGIYNAGTLVVSNCVVSGNATGNDPYGYGGVHYGKGGDGGGIYNLGTLNCFGTTVSGNRAGAGWRTNCIGGSGGGIYSGGTLNMSGSTISGNYAGHGDTAATGGDGGGVSIGAGQCVVSNCVFAGNSAGSGGGGPTDGKYNGGTGGLGGNGGGICDKSVGPLRTLIINCTFTNNRAGYGGGGGYGQASPGSGNTGGAGGGVFAAASLAMSGCTVVGNTAGPGGGAAVNFGGSAGRGGRGGDGGGIYAGELLLTNCTIVGNSGGGGGDSEYNAGGSGGNGGGLYSCSTNEFIIACTIFSNNVGKRGYLFSSEVTNGIGGGILSAVVGGPFLLNDIVAQNGNGGDIAGTFQSLGGNLIGTDPQLAPLADNGGPTSTMALLPGSPAIDAGAASGAPATDQRGVPRPQGAGVDIGAFEYLSSPIFTGATMLNATTRQLQLSGLTPNQTLTLQVSTNLMSWWDVTNFTSGANGVFQCVDPTCTGGPARFYRLKSDSP
jgi:hypothetical protein